MAKVIAKIFAVAFLLAGIAGFIPGLVDDGHMLGLEVSAVHNIVHLLTGVIALFVMGSESGSRMFLKIFGIVYALVAIIGFSADGEILGLFHTNMADNVFHAVVALIALIGGFSRGSSSAMVA